MDTFKSTLNSLKKSIYPQKSKSSDDGKTVKNNTLNENHSQKNKKTKFEKLKTYVQNTFPTMSATNVGLAIVAIVVVGKIGISRDEIMSLIQDKWNSRSTQKKVKKKRTEKDYNMMFEEKYNMKFESNETNDEKFKKCITNSDLINLIEQESFNTADDGNNKNPILFNIATICNTPTNLGAERTNIKNLRESLIKLGFNREISIPEEQRFACCMYRIMNNKKWYEDLKHILFLHNTLQNGKTQK